MAWCLRKAAVLAVAVAAVAWLGASGQRSNAAEPVARPAPRIVMPIDLAEKCARLRRVADRLGETYAGMRLRRTVVARTCAFAGEASGGERLWSWPWARGGVDGELPPRRHGVFEAWAIHCGLAGDTERCALIHEADANILPADGGAERVRLITHFVIDEIGGREQVLWRLYAERLAEHWFEPGGGAGTAGPSFDLVRARSGAVLVREAFDHCGPLGCQMEADIATGARVATRLRDGANVNIELRPAPGLVLSQAIPAAGFAEGLAELSRLKRREPRIAGR